ncbi:MAG: alpha/beta hydrolase [Myxococcales bacterium]|nr:alpha/beta hydrolase [Myxococcales bacterium]
MTSNPSIEHTTQTTESWITNAQGVRLFTVSRGEGLPLLFCNGLGVSADSFWPAICRPLSAHVRTINWDYQGHGRSENPLPETQMSLRICVDDLIQVMDHYGLEKAVLVGHSMGVQIGLECLRYYPERVQGFIPMLGTFQRPFDTFMRFKYASDVFEKVSSWIFDHPDTTAEVWPKLFQTWLADPVARVAGIVNRRYFPSSEIEMYLGHLRKMSPLIFFELARSLQEHSADDMLESVEIPTLIFAGEKDLFTPPEVSKEMHARIPSAELQWVQDGSHAAMVEHPDLFWLRMLHFLQKHFPEQVLSPAQVLANQSSPTLQNTSESDLPLDSAQKA